MMHKTPYITILIIFACALSSCADMPSSSGQASDATKSQIQHVQKLLETGKHQEAATIFWSIAATKPSPQREALQIRAVEALLRPQTKLQARQYLNAIDERMLTQDLFIKKRVATAELELMSGQPQLALEAVQAKFIELSTKYKPHVLAVRARALQEVGQTRESIEARVTLSPLLKKPDQLSRNKQLIWQSLSNLDMEEINEWIKSRLDPRLSAWLSLISLQKQPHETLHSLENHLQKWHLQHPNHSVPNRILESVTKNWKPPRISPSIIALLLPMTGRYSDVAQAIYAGITTAREFGEALDPLPEVILYDTGDNPSTAINYYHKAVNEGADFIIGPLQKEAVNILASQKQLSVPSLSLNYADNILTGSQNLFQFGLLPEDEARQVAERASLDNHLTALALVPEGEWGTRLLKAFTSHFFSLGGVVLQSERYITKNADYSATIKSLLQLDQSEQRHRNIQSILKQKVKFKPRRRQDADFIFIAASPRQARLLRPQLSYHYASDLPVYATSHIFSGKENTSADQDINDIIYCDIPWLLSTDPVVELLRDLSDLQLSNNQSHLPRFAALGVDTYQIIPHLRYLATYENERYSGMTGKISIGKQNRIYRELTWAKFKSGFPQKLRTETLAPSNLFHHDE